MKNFFAVVRGTVTGIYDTEEAAKIQVNNYFDGKYKGFETREEAENYLKYYNEVTKPYLYAVKIGRKPGIYYDREEAGKQVEGFEGAWLRKYEIGHLEQAENFLKSKAIKKESVNKKEKKENQTSECIMKPIVFHNKYVCFMDCEANNNKVISIGAVILDTISLHSIDYFYSTCKPKSFEKMDYFCKKITHLSTIDIKNSEDFLIVYEKFYSLLKKYDCNEICTWSNSDKKFMQSTVKELEQNLPKELNFIDIQKRIGYFAIKNKTTSLESMKRHYNLEGKVQHHALKDAQDMLNVYLCYKKEIQTS